MHNLVSVVLAWIWRSFTGALFILDSVLLWAVACFSGFLSSVQLALLEVPSHGGF